MIAKDVYHDSHGLFLCADSSGWFLVSLPVSSLFIPNISLIGGVHATPKMVLAPMESLDISAKLTVIFLRRFWLIDLLEWVVPSLVKCTLSVIWKGTLTFTYWNQACCLLGTLVMHLLRLC